MYWHKIAGNWKQFRGNIRETYGKLTDNDILVLSGRRDQLLGQIQVCCGIKPEDAEQELKDCGFLK